jgi:hypothetical protein
LHVTGGGQPQSILRRQCTSAYKVLPVRAKVRELLGVAKFKHVPRGTQVNQWLGISLDEQQRMKESGVSWQTNVFPLVEMRMRREDCVRWLQSQNYRVPSKSSCYFCPFKSRAHWLEMQANDSASFARAVEFDEAIRRGVRGISGQAFLHRDCIPLAAIAPVANLFSDVDMDDECDGVCGV